LRRYRPLVTGLIALAFAAVIFILPFAFIALQAVKSRSEASRLDFSLPKSWLFVDNLVAVIEVQDYQLLLAFFNSSVITVAAVILLIILSAMVGYIMQRRKTRWNGVAQILLLVGLMMPPAVVPTIWLLQSIGLFKSIFGMILIQVAYNLSFSSLLYRSFIATIPRDLDEAAIIDGARPLDVFFRVILPLLQPALITTVIFTFIWTYDDFFAQLIYLSTAAKETVPVALRQYIDSSGGSSYGQMLAMSALSLLPTFIVFLVSQRRIVEGISTTGIRG